jgi:hypothetical protein
MRNLGSESERSGDLIIVDTGRARFNWMDYEGTHYVIAVSLLVIVEVFIYLVGQAPRSA